MQIKDYIGIAIVAAAVILLWIFKDRVTAYFPSQTEQQQTQQFENFGTAGSFTLGLFGTEGVKAIGNVFNEIMQQFSPGGGAR